MAPKHLPVRPTTDRAKEALFNILGHQYFLDEMKVLDLFAGIGSISFEFASRGTTDLTAVDRNQGCTDFIKKTADELGIDLQVFTQDVSQFISQTDNSYDIIFADPPYELTGEELTSLIDLTFKNHLLKEKGILILEHSKHTDLSTHPKFVQDRNYGLSTFSWFEG
jgi:16S rRNA (guanine(966)-N(2))-methyltransferase RsmD